MREQFRARRLPAMAAALALTGVLTACGGGSSGGGGGNTPSTLPAAPVRTLIGSQGFTVLGTVDANRAGLARDEYLAGVTVSQAGTLEIIADWTFASNDVDIHLYSGNCTPQLLTTTGCTRIAAADSVNNKPERLTFNAAAGTYTIGIANFGRSNESGNFQVYLTR